MYIHEKIRLQLHDEVWDRERILKAAHEIPCHGAKHTFFGTMDLEGVLNALAGLIQGRCIAPMNIRHSLKQRDEFADRLQIKEPLPGVSVLLGTSGTTGTPKIVCHSLETLFYSAAHQHPDYAIDENAHCCLMLPLYHIAGLALFFRWLYYGFTLHLPTSTEREMTHGSAVPSLLQKLISENLPIPKKLLLGGSIWTKELAEEAKKRGVDLFPSYGMTETATQIYTRDRVLQGRALKIDAAGELFVQGKTLFLGYLKDHEIDPPPLWFATNDLGEISTDGRLTIRGRKDRTIISGGVNIDLTTVEKALLEHPSVTKALATSLKDPFWGARPMAYVVVQEEITEQMLKKWLEGHLAKYEIPDQIHVTRREVESA